MVLTRGYFSLMAPLGFLRADQQARPEFTLSGTLRSAWFCHELACWLSQTAPTLKIKGFNFLSNYFWRPEPTKASVLRAVPGASISQVSKSRSRVCTSDGEH